MKKDLPQVLSFLFCLYSVVLGSGCGSKQEYVNSGGSLAQDSVELSEVMEEENRIPTNLDAEMAADREAGMATDMEDSTASIIDDHSFENSDNFGISAVPPWGQSGAIVTTSVLWKTPSASLLSYNHYTPLWHYKGSTYFVWVDSGYRPWVTKITSGRAETVPLDPGTDYAARPDGHNRFSMGIDKNGYVHIAGDMHNYTYKTTEGNSIPYPARYQKQAILYWKSKQPESVAGGFAFAGGRGASTALPGTGWTYGRFFTDNTGELYYSSRVKAIFASHAPGEMGLGLYRYNASTQTWAALGGLADRIRDGEYYKVILWEMGGMAPTGWYQGFLSHIKFDSGNRMHLAASINTNTALAGNNRLIYAMSADGGVTWKKANGVRIPGLPIRAANGKANMGDLVAEVSAEPFFGSEIGVVADQYGKPGVVAGNTTEGVWRNWDGSKWVVNSALIGANVPSPTFGNLSSDNTMVLTMQRSAKFLHTDVFQRRAFGYDLNGYKGYVSVDEYGLRTTGGVYGVGIDETAKTESVLRTTVTPAPLPCTWMSKDIAASGGPGYAGMSGFANRTFVVTNYGVVLDNTNDSFHYTYGKFTGDGTIVARVNANAPSSNARAGVMMRETLNPNSKHAMMTIGPVKGAYFGFRNSTGGSTSNLNTAGITTPYWVKLTRKGSTFTGSISSDGITWKEAGKSSISMSSTIHVGLASASYHRYGMQTVKFERVSAPGCQP